MKTYKVSFLLNCLTKIWLSVGQEEGDVNYEEGIQFTPFNMKEEMEEGHFNQEGMYIFNKEVCKLFYL